MVNCCRSWSDQPESSGPDTTKASFPFSAVAPKHLYRSMFIESPGVTNCHHSTVTIWSKQSTNLFHGANGGVWFAYKRPTRISPGHGISDSLKGIPNMLFSL